MTMNLSSAIAMRFTHDSYLRNHNNTHNGTNNDMVGKTFVNISVSKVTWFLKKEIVYTSKRCVNMIFIFTAHGQGRHTWAWRGTQRGFLRSYFSTSSSLSQNILKFLLTVPDLSFYVSLAHFRQKPDIFFQDKRKVSLLTHNMTLTLSSNANI